MFISGMSGNEIFCLAQKGLYPGEITVGNSVCSLGLGGALGSFAAPGAGAFLAAAAAHAVVVPSLLARAAGLGAGDPASPSFEAATTFLVIAGLMNVLLAFDAWDAAGEKRP